MSARRDGFSLVELMMVVLVIGILARIALPAFHEVRLRARAAQALGDINAIRLAAYTYNADTGEWPPDVNRGVVPPELAPHLPPGFTFNRDGYRLDWDNWMLPDGTPRHGTEVLVGVSMATDQEALGRALISLLGESVARFTISEHYTFVMIGAS